MIMYSKIKTHPKIEVRAIIILKEDMPPYGHRFCYAECEPSAHVVCKALAQRTR